MTNTELIKQHIYTGLEKLHTCRTGMDIHATNLIDFCPREFALCKQMNLLYNDEERVTGNRIITFKVGTAVEGVILEAIKVADVSAKIDPFYLNITSDIQVIGTPDGAMYLDRPEIPYIIELKTTGKDEIETMVSPYINHCCQIALYLWLAEIRKAPFVYDVGYVIYISKLEKKEQMKVYEVQRNDAFIARVREQLLAVKTFSKTGELPPRICNSPIALMARTQCRIPKLCFG